MRGHIGQLICTKETCFGIGIIRTEWNQEIINHLEKSCTEALIELGVNSKNILSYTVPGSYELPMGAKLMLNSIHKPDAVICLGCVIQGATKHDDYINHMRQKAYLSDALPISIPPESYMGDKKGLTRYGHAYVTLDEALSRVVVDLSGRPGLDLSVKFTRDRVGSFDLDLIREFFQGFVNHSLVTLHIDNLKGINSHHQAETVFKAFGRALRMATTPDERQSNIIPSTKGSL